MFIYLNDARKIINLSKGILVSFAQWSHVIDAAAIQKIGFLNAPLAEQVLSGWAGHVRGLSRHREVLLYETRAQVNCKVFLFSVGLICG